METSRRFAGRHFDVFVPFKVVLDNQAQDLQFGQQQQLYYQRFQLFYNKKEQDYVKS